MIESQGRSIKRHDKRKDKRKIQMSKEVGKQSARASHSLVNDGYGTEISVGW